MKYVMTILALGLMGCTRSGNNAASLTIDFRGATSASKVSSAAKMQSASTQEVASSTTGLIESSLNSYADANCFAVMVGNPEDSEGNVCRGINNQQLASFGSYVGFHPIDSAISIDITPGTQQIYILVTKSTDGTCGDITQMSQAYYRPYMAGSTVANILPGNNVVSVKLDDLNESNRLNSCDTISTLKPRVYLSKSPGQLNAKFDLNAAAIGTINGNFTYGNESYSSTNILVSANAFQFDGSTSIDSQTTMTAVDFNSFSFSAVYQPTYTAVYNLFYAGLTEVRWEQTVNNTNLLVINNGSQQWQYEQTTAVSGIQTLVVSINSGVAKAWINGQSVPLTAYGTQGGTTENQVYFGYQYLGSMYETSIMPALSDADANNLACYFAKQYSISQTASCY